MLITIKSLYLHYYIYAMGLSQLKEIRKSQSITIQELSKRTGINRNTLSKIENNKANPTWSTLENICIELQAKIEITKTT